MSVRFRALPTRGRRGVVRGASLAGVLPGAATVASCAVRSGNLTRSLDVPAAARARTSRVIGHRTAHLSEEQLRAVVAEALSESLPRDGPDV